MITLFTGHCILVVWMVCGCFVNELNETYSRGWNDGCRAAVTYYERKKED